MKNLLNSSIISGGVLWMLAAAPGYAQGQDSLKLQDLTVPVSPAFAVLDEAPTIIDRPQTARALAAGLYNALDQKTGLPNSYAAEFTPFWFIRHAKMNTFKYFGTNTEGTQQRSSPLARASVSVAFINKQPLADAPEISVSTFSYGGRATLFKVVRADAVIELMAAYDESSTALDTVLARFDKAYPDAPFADKSVRQQNYKDFYPTQRAYLQQSRDRLRAALSQKPIFQLDGALAHSTFFPGNTFENRRSGRTGIWVTASYSKKFTLNQPTSSALNGSTNKASYYINIYGIARKMWDQTLADTTDLSRYLKVENFDAGGKIELEFSNIAVSYEAVVRTVTGSDRNKNVNARDSWRSVGNIRYRLSNSTAITGAFGRNYGKRENLLFILGINWLISNGNENVTVE